MARPKTVSDEAILDAAAAAAGRVGPANLTFGLVAKAVGLSPATLVQRYGTRDRLLQAALLRAWDLLDEQTAANDAIQPLTPEGAVALLVALSPIDESETAYAQGLLLLSEDVRDAALRARGAAWREVLSTALGRRLPVAPERQHALGRLMASQWQGIRIWWAFERHGNEAQQVAAELLEWLSAVGVQKTT
jgi:AcrR family transcriptional regulator